MANVIELRPKNRIKLTKTISFSLFVQDKEKIQQKTKKLGIPLATMIWGIVLEKYQTLAIGYITPGAFPGKLIGLTSFSKNDIVS